MQPAAAKAQLKAQTGTTLPDETNFKNKYFSRKRGKTYSILRRANKNKVVHERKYKLTENCPNILLQIINGTKNTHIAREVAAAVCPINSYQILAFLRRLKALALSFLEPNL